MKKILFLAYHYPPSGGAGVQRPSKFVKWLPEFGYRPIVLTGMGRLDNRHIPVDYTLNREIEDVILYRIKLTALEDSMCIFFSKKLFKLIPSIGRKWWMRGAVRTCEEVIEAEKPEVIYVTVSPFEAASLGARVAEKYDIPWVLDMRDPWALDPSSYYTTWLNYYSNLKVMRRVCRSANAVIMNTPRSLEELRRRFPELSSDKLLCITNGWDKDDIVRSRTGLETNTKSKTLTIVHTGQFQTRLAIEVDPYVRRILESGGKNFRDSLRYSPGKSNLLARTPYYLLKSIRKLLNESRIKKGDIRLIFAGVTVGEDINLCRRFELEEIVEFKGYVSHDETIRDLMSADVLFLPLHEPGNGQFTLSVPGKTYEYIATRKPILALVPPGDAREFVQRSGLGFICDPTNEHQITQTLLDLLYKHRSPVGLTVKADERFIEQFERKVLTGKLAEVLDFVTNE